MWASIIFFGIIAYANFKAGKKRLGYVGVVFVVLGFGALFSESGSDSQSGSFLHPLPTGVSSPDSVVIKAVERSKLSYEPAMAEEMGSDTSDTDQIMVMKNPKTHHFVFNYKFKNKLIPVYAVYSRVEGSHYNAYLIPAEKSNIDNIMTDGSVADKQIKADRYYGYSYDDVEALNIDNAFDGSMHPDQRTSGKYIVTYR